MFGSHQRSAKGDRPGGPVPHGRAAAALSDAIFAEGVKKRIDYFSQIEEKKLNIHFN
jgi:hypothetical protein